MSAKIAPLLFVERSRLEELSETVRADRVPDQEPVRDYSPLAIRVARGFIRHLTVRLVTAGAVALRRGWPSRRHV
jgi:hypothetical protein